MTVRRLVLLRFCFDLLTICYPVTFNFVHCLYYYSMMSPTHLRLFASSPPLPQKKKKKKKKKKKCEPNLSRVRVRKKNAQKLKFGSQFARTSSQSSQVCKFGRTK
uniref:Uncharacterized protein n=1 Tax=Cacopsylla melanoneura TaxID=428564 RepID=A0A8D9A425_9HEMI